MKFVIGMRGKVAFLKVRILENTQGRCVMSEKREGIVRAGA